MQLLRQGPSMAKCEADKGGAKEAALNTLFSNMADRCLQNNDGCLFSGKGSSLNWYR